MTIDPWYREKVKPSAKVMSFLVKGYPPETITFQIEDGQTVTLTFPKKYLKGSTVSEKLPELLRLAAKKGDYQELILEPV